MVDHLWTTAGVRPRCMCGAIVKRWANSQTTTESPFVSELAEREGMLSYLSGLRVNAS
jgi:hypothetical protein